MASEAVCCSCCCCSCGCQLYSKSPSDCDGSVQTTWPTVGELDQGCRAERARYDELVKELQSSTERLEEARIRRQEAVAKLKALEERAGKLDGAVKEVGDAVGVGGVFGLMNYFMSEDARIDQTIQKVSALKNRATQ
eukprot:TRINITY_DN29849_c0_g1_i2.p2 TRINITY_DN29849_c0_g1~~TRINITY_DN29849_c0_g1_i2.p2  ORF type:complete len:137 (+),score=29.21 TRINITY_DN29849_c0_g1_i2:292-702(+)